MSKGTAVRATRNSRVGGGAVAALALLVSCSSESVGSRTSPGSGELGGSPGASGGAAGSSTAGSSSASGGASGAGGTGGNSGASGSGITGSGGHSVTGAGGAELDAGRGALGGDSGSSCVPGGPCKLSVGPCHVGTVFCDAVGIGWCRDDGPIADGTHCGTHGTCNAGTCVETTPCNVTYDCPAGQTCWTKDGSWFDCLPSGAGVLGDSCDPSVFATVSCGDGMACVGAASLGGHCTAWCNSMPCPSGKTCTSVTTTKGVTLQFCF